MLFNKICPKEQILLNNAKSQFVAQRGILDIQSKLIFLLKKAEDWKIFWMNTRVKNTKY